MEIKLLTLNIWRYFGWKERKKALIEFLKKENPDIICLQEVNNDPKFNEGNANQAELIAKALNYKYWAFAPISRMEKWNGVPLDREVWMGDAIISKSPINEETHHILKRYPQNGDGKDFGFLHTKIAVDYEEIDVVSVHFANNDKSSKLHLKETLDWCKRKGIKPIIAGDFNMIKTKNLEIADKEYEISYKIKKYLSFPPTPFSYNKVPVTLDYIITNKERFKIKSIECKEKVNVSDHKPVISKIALISS
ncbi:endonuclease/exonuclease/phosphatase family protein [Nanoarchaeota archaeon]